ncbi:uncharacterized protein LOC130635760 isoform X2 [Hydractinia symbiolongicarpus]|uniref:uncharacterized protein LOC130635751 isoform X2 n=1 Tax=Hydractinia symbiolongicarpus TaxID=13093 RepID=UPI00254B8927|nr:uncharacterized protein LOC130635751 isoform X2 [Hydractinia symbiolongicarpus]XP_057301205.1 uncharacterized protein LOC130635760 isoform X2 [Hydractinia symbiolongicarpus]
MHEVNMKSLCICLTLLVKLNPVICGTVEAVKTNLELPFNETLNLYWRIVLDVGEEISTANVYVLGSPNVQIIKFISTITAAGNAMFGNRLSGSLSKDIYALSIKNIQYNEQKSFNLKVIFQSPVLHAKNATVVLKEVVGGPDVCGISLKSSYIVNEGKKLSFLSEVCGNPKPILTWKMENELEYSYSADIRYMDKSTMRYQYVYKTRSHITRKDCGTKIIFNATGANKMITGEAVISVTFSPQRIRKVKFYKDNNCINGTWTSEATGNCALNYHLQFAERSDILNTSDTHYAVCNIFNVSSVVIWASYKNNYGQKAKVNISLTTPTPSTKVTDACKQPTSFEGSQTNCRNKESVKKDDENKDAQDYEVFPNAVSHYTGLQLEAREETVYANLSPTPVNEYAEVGTENNSRQK